MGGLLIANKVVHEAKSKKKPCFVFKANFEKAYDSACGLGDADHKKVIVFGGFGGMGRHARRNDLLLLDPYSGNLDMVSTVGCASPSPRLGHTASLVGNRMFVIGGRTGPDKILSDVWILDTTKNSWNLLQCGDSGFPPR